MALLLRTSLTDDFFIPSLMSLLIKTFHNFIVRILTAFDAENVVLVFFWIMRKVMWVSFC